MKSVSNEPLKVQKRGFRILPVRDIGLGLCDTFARRPPFSSGMCPSLLCDTTNWVCLVFVGGSTFHITSACFTSACVKTLSSMANLMLFSASVEMPSSALHDAHPQPPWNFAIQRLANHQTIFVCHFHKFKFVKQHACLKL